MPPLCLPPGRPPINGSPSCWRGLAAGGGMGAVCGLKPAALVQAAGLCHKQYDSTQCRAARLADSVRRINPAATILRVGRTAVDSYIPMHGSNRELGKGLVEKIKKDLGLKGE